MRIISLNANGIRSAASKGVFDWLRAQDADVVCLQETKAQEHQLADPMFRPDGHHCFYRDASHKKGYSGVAIYARREPDQVLTELGWDEFDNEGRYIEARFGNLSVVSLYFPSGSSGDERQQFKFKAMEWITPIFDALAEQRPRLCDLRRLEHRAHQERHQELELQPEEFRLPARGARVAGPAVPAARLGRQLPCDQARGGGIHLVVQPWPGARQQRGLAHRLPGGARPRCASACATARSTATQRFSDHAPYTVDYAD